MRSQETQRDAIVEVVKQAIRSELPIWQGIPVGILQNEDLLTQRARSYMERLDDLESTVLMSLKFLVMHDREADISPRQEKTFDWIFCGPGPSHKPWSNFRGWLKAEREIAHNEITDQRKVTTNSGLYWINGKAGSGKSTLMKHIYNHRETRSALQEWAGDSVLLMARFFFWYGGSKLQKSQPGLLRALLYACLQSRKELIPIVAQDIFSLRPEELEQYWTLHRLKIAFEKVLSQTQVCLKSRQVTRLKFCFFIDGLDEYGDGHQEIAELMASFARFPHVKLCVSSRPLLIFESLLGGFPQMILQNLTLPDIRQYINNKLDHSDKMKKLEQKEPGLKTSLADYIASKADGVFLWVILIVKSLLEGLKNGDCGTDLKQRLYNLPRDLDSLYRHMISRVDPPFYLEQGFKYLLLVEAAGSSPSLLLMAFADIEVNDPRTEEISVERFKEAMTGHCATMKERIQTRCLGLLELSSLEFQDPTKQPRVNFLHKSVMDFLNTTETQQLIAESFHASSKPKPEPELELMKAHLKMLNSFYLWHENYTLLRLDRKKWFELVRSSARDFMKVASIRERKTGKPNVKMIDELDTIVTKLWDLVPCRLPAEESGDIHWSETHSNSGVMSSVEDDILLIRRRRGDQTNQIGSFAEYCEKNGLHLYVKEKFPTKSNSIDEGVHQIVEASGRLNCLKAAEEILGSRVKHETTVWVNHAPQGTYCSRECEKQSDNGHNSTSMGVVRNNTGNGSKERTTSISLATERDSPSQNSETLTTRRSIDQFQETKARVKVQSPPQRIVRESRTKPPVRESRAKTPDQPKPQGTVRESNKTKTIDQPHPQRTANESRTKTRNQPQTHGIVRESKKKTPDQPHPQQTTKESRTKTPDQPHPQGTVRESKTKTTDQPHPQPTARESRTRKQPGRPPPQRRDKASKIANPMSVDAPQLHVPSDSPRARLKRDQEGRRSNPPTSRRRSRSQSPNSTSATVAYSDVARRDDSLSDVSRTRDSLSKANSVSIRRQKAPCGIIIRSILLLKRIILQGY